MYYKLYSQREKEKEQKSDVYSYDCFPEGFRNQLMLILRDLFNSNKLDIFSHNMKPNFWESTCSGFAREKGLKFLESQYGQINNVVALEDYIDTCDDNDFLDLLDYLVGYVFKSGKFTRCHMFEQVTKAIDELNARFKQHSLGYEFINGELIKKTNEIMHVNVVKPALGLLHDRAFEGAEQEYLKAFDCFKKCDNKNAILEAAKSFESVMKTICKKNNYTYDEKDTASKLIRILEENSFFPSYLNSHLSGIRTTLESGAPTLRNKIAGHGQGDSVVEVSDEYVEYALNLVATNIVFLVKIFNQSKKVENESDDKE